MKQAICGLIGSCLEDCLLDLLKEQKASSVIVFSHYPKRIVLSDWIKWNHHLEIHSIPSLFDFKFLDSMSYLVLDLCFEKIDKNLVDYLVSLNCDFTLMTTPFHSNLQLFDHEKFWRMFKHVYVTYCHKEELVYLCDKFGLPPDEKWWDCLSTNLLHDLPTKLSLK